MKTNVKKELKLVIKGLAIIASEYQSRIEEYEEEGKEYTPAAEKAQEELDEIMDAANTLCSLLDIDFDEVIENI